MKKALFLIVVSFWILTTLSRAESGPPAICKPCLFYGGDLNASDPSAAVFPNENTEIISETETYGAISIPKSKEVAVEGILFQTVIEFGPPLLDPKQASWEIRTDIFSGGGTVVASGGGSVYMRPTGRNYRGWPEYTIAVEVNPPVKLSGGSKYPGTMYWFNLTPQCTNTDDEECYNLQYFASNTTQLTNGFRTFAQATDQIALDSQYFEWDWSQCGTAGYSGQQCADLSFGLIGTVVQ